MDTTQFGWPISVPVKTVGPNIYFDVRKGLSYFGFKRKTAEKGGLQTN